MLNYFSNIFLQGIYLFRRELRVRYRRTALSLLWVAIPTLTASAGAVVASRQMEVSGADTSEYALKIFLGVMLIQLFTDSFTSPQQIAMRCRQFIRFIPYTYEAILISGVLFALLNFLIKSVLLVGFLVAFEVQPHFVGLIAGLPSMVFLCLFGLSLSALAIPLSYVYWDVRYGQSYVVMAALFATPVLYPAPTKGILAYVNAINPLTPLVVFGRDAFFSTVSYAPGLWQSCFGIAVFCVLSVLYFRRAMPIGISHI